MKANHWDITDIPSFISALLAEQSAQLVLELIDHTRTLPNWNYDGRVLPEHLVYLVTDSAFQAVIDGEERRFDTGTLLWMRPGEKHSFMLVNPKQIMRVIHLRFRLIKGSKELSVDRPFFVTREIGAARGHLEQMLDAARSRLPLREVTIRALLALVLSRFVCGSQNFHGSRILSHEQRTRLMGFIDAEKSARISHVSLARLLGLSATYFSRLFRNTYGEAPKIWLVRHRIQQAAEDVLGTDTPFGEIAERYGYSDDFLFSRQFKSVMGMSPRAYRQEHRTM